MPSLKLKRDATPSFGKPGGCCGIWAAMLPLIHHLQSDEDFTRPEVATWVDDTLLHLCRAGIIDLAQLGTARLALDVWIRCREARDLHTAGEKLLDAVCRRIRTLKWSPDNPEKATELERLHAIGDINTVTYHMEIAGDALEYALTLDEVHLRYRHKFSEELQAAVDAPKLPDLLVQSKKFAASVLEHNYAGYPSEMAAIEAYRKGQPVAGIPLPDVAGTDDGALACLKVPDPRRT